ncbi:MAG TPA: hypothetical protein VFB30_01430 [Spirochaetia bacterium]|nr:hypothetical protein [Spirochaetia bacterium]
MKISCRELILPVMAVTAAAMITGCPLPFDYKAPGAANSQASDPSSPSITASVVV